MQERQDIIAKIRDDSKESLKSKLKDKKAYKALLKGMIIQVRFTGDFKILGSDKADGKRSSG
jgi:hypothetical protein